MRPFREACAALWSRLNPSEPNAAFLATLMATALALFAIALVIGQL